MKRWWHDLREKTVEHRPWEMLLMRALFAWLMWRMLPDSVPFTEQALPTGLARLLDLTFLGNPGVFPVLRHVAPFMLALYVAGIAPLLTLGFMAALLTACGALENAQGAIGHHLQLLCLVAVAQWVAYAVDALGAGSRRFALAPHGAQLQATQAAKLMIAAAYVASGCMKLIASQGLWIWTLPDISLQLVKTHANIFYDTLVPTPAWAENMTRFIAAHPNLTRMAFAPGLLLELGAFLALTGRRAALAIGFGLLAMHVLARWVMELAFPAHEGLLLIFFVNVPWLASLVAARWRGR